mgnify:CR=1 FL=1
MRRALVLIMALTLLVGTACARAEAESDLSTRGYGEYAVEYAGESLSAAWTACADAFRDSLERVRDDSVLREGWDALRLQLNAAGDSLYAGLLELRAQLDERAAEWSGALSDWLAEHGPELETAADQAGQSLAEALNAADAALDSAGGALRAALDGLHVGQ